MRTLLVRWCVLVFCLFAPVMAGAQDTAPDYEDWTRTAARVDRVLTAGRATDATLEGLRQDLVAYRDAFMVEESRNDARIDRVERQLATLGPAPAEPETEPPEVAQRRTQLNDELNDLRVPSLRATEAFVEADSLIAEIDSELRQRQANQILTRQPTPLNPVNWVGTVESVRAIAARVPREVLDRLDSEQDRIALSANLAGAVLLAMVGVFLLFRFRRMADAVDRRLDTLTYRPLRRALRLLIVLLQLFLPWLGLSLLLASLQATGLFGPTATAGLISLSYGGFLIIFGTWVVTQLFAGDRSRNLVDLTDARAASALRVSRLMVYCLAVYETLTAIYERTSLDATSIAYLHVPLILVTSVVTYRLARIFADVHKDLAPGDENGSSEPSPEGFALILVSIFTRFLSTVSVLAPFACAAGYIALAEQTLLPAAQTILVSGMFVLIYRAVVEFYLIVSRRTPSDEGLVPTMIGTVIVLVSLPVISLIWGARVTDLTELWSKAREGFAFGDVQISPTETFTFFVIFAIGYGLTRLVQVALRNTVLPRTRLDLGARTAAVSGVGYIGILLAALVAISAAGINLSSLAIFASALAVGIGFGLQTIVSNFVSGIILLIERPVSEGDWIEVAGQMGYVRSISVRSTRIETFDRTDVIIPNSDLITGQVTNWTRGNLIGRLIISVGVAYGTDTRRVERILADIANAHPMVVLSPPPAILFMGFGADSLDFEIRVILRDINFMLSVKSDMNHEIARRFAEENIEIPFAQRDLWIRNPEALRGGAPQQTFPKPPPEMPAPAPARRIDPDHGDMNLPDGDAD